MSHVFGMAVGDCGCLCEKVKKEFRLGAYAKTPDGAGCFLATLDGVYPIHVFFENENIECEDHRKAVPADLREHQWYSGKTLIYEGSDSSFLWEIPYPDYGRDDYFIPFNYILEIIREDGTVERDSQRSTTSTNAGTVVWSALPSYPAFPYIYNNDNLEHTYSTQTGHVVHWDLSQLGIDFSKQVVTLSYPGGSSGRAITSATGTQSIILNNILDPGTATLSIDWTDFQGNRRFYSISIKCYAFDQMTVQPENVRLMDRKYTDEWTFRLEKVFPTSFCFIYDTPFESGGLRKLAVGSGRSLEARWMMQGSNENWGPWNTATEGTIGVHISQSVVASTTPSSSYPWFLAGLNPETVYRMQVRMVYEDSTGVQPSPWSDVVEFTTPPGNIEKTVANITVTQLIEGTTAIAWFGCSTAGPDPAPIEETIPGYPDRITVRTQYDYEITWNCNGISERRVISGADRNVRFDPPIEGIEYSVRARTRYSYRYYFLTATEAVDWATFEFPGAYCEPVAFTVPFSQGRVTKLHRSADYDETILSLTERTHLFQWGNHPKAASFRLFAWQDGGSFSQSKSLYAAPPLSSGKKGAIMQQLNNEVYSLSPTGTDLIANFLALSDVASCYKTDVVGISFHEFYRDGSYDKNNDGVYAVTRSVDEGKPGLRKTRILALAPRSYVYSDNLSPVPISVIGGKAYRQSVMNCGLAVYADLESEFDFIHVSITKDGGIGGGQIVPYVPLSSPTIFAYPVGEGTTRAVRYGMIRQPKTGETPGIKMVPDIRYGDSVVETIIDFQRDFDIDSSLGNGNGTVYATNNGKVVHVTKENRGEFFCGYGFDFDTETRQTRPRYSRLTDVNGNPIMVTSSDTRKYWYSQTDGTPPNAGGLVYYEAFETQTTSNAEEAAAILASHQKPFPLPAFPVETAIAIAGTNYRITATNEMFSEYDPAYYTHVWKVKIVDRIAKSGDLIAVIRRIENSSSRYGTSFQFDGAGGVKHYAFSNGLIRIADTYDCAVYNILTQQRISFEERDTPFSEYDGWTDFFANSHALQGPTGEIRLMEAFNPEVVTTPDTCAYPEGFTDGIIQAGANYSPGVRYPNRLVQYPLPGGKAHNFIMGTRSETEETDDWESNLIAREAKYCSEEFTQWDGCVTSLRTIKYGDEFHPIGEPLTPIDLSALTPEEREYLESDE